MDIYHVSKKFPKDELYSLIKYTDTPNDKTDFTYIGIENEIEFFWDNTGNKININ